MRLPEGSINNSCGSAMPNDTNSMDSLYSLDEVSFWQNILGREMHYHFGHFHSPEVDFEEALRQAVRNFFPHIPVGANVVDAGCGWGGPADLLRAERACVLHCLTVSNAQVAHCESRGLSCEYHDLETGLPPEMRADVGLMFESLEHVQDKQVLLRDARDKCSRLLLRINCCADMRLTLLNAGNPWLLRFEPPEVILSRLERAGWRIDEVVNRRPESMPTLRHWQERLIQQADRVSAHQQSGLLLSMCNQALESPEQWAANYPLMDIVAS